jgi:tripartite-type tricarboxylate transporter receptor subunit TctC
MRLPHLSACAIAVAAVFAAAAASAQRYPVKPIRIVKLPDVKERLNSQGLDAVGSTPDQFSATIRSEIGSFAKLVKQIGFKPQ